MELFELTTHASVVFVPSSPPLFLPLGSLWLLGLPCSPLALPLAPRWLDS